MKSKFTWCGLLFLSLALVVALPGALANEDGDDLGGGLGFGQRVAGTYLDEGFVGAAEWIGFQTINADGTFTSTNTVCCGGAAPDGAGGGNLQSPGHGVWVRTGVRQITMTALIVVQPYAVDAAGCKLGCPADIQVIAKPTLIMDFDEDFETATGVINTGIYLPFLPDQDPLTDLPANCLEGEDTFRRLHVAPLCSELP